MWKAEGGNSGHPVDSDGLALRQLTLLTLGGLACSIFVLGFMVLAAIQAVSMIDAAARERETLQVTRGIAAAPGGINQITLETMAALLDLDRARMTTLDDVADGELSVLVSPGGDRVVAWTPRLLGSMTFEVVAPFRIAAGTVFVLIVGVLGWRIALIGRRLDRRRAAAARLAMTDALTGLGNRLAFDMALDRRRKQNAGFVVVLFDLDGFKEINDAFGHAAGDVVLQRVAQHLREVAEPDDLVTRLGGDEFAVIRPESGLDGYLGAVRARFAAPIEIGPRLVPVATSIGIARHADFSGSAIGLIHAADTALYRAKRSGRGRAELAGAPRVAA